jgi:AbrB family looped-hinge helix DNA binding protein
MRKGEPALSYNTPPITVVIWIMSMARSKVTAQGQISIPADVRRKLGVGPGSVLEWEEAGDKVLVRRAGTFNSEDIHKAIFGARIPAERSLDELKEGIRRHVRTRYARS